MPASARIVELAREILTGTEKIDAYLEGEGIPTPSFDENAPKQMNLKDQTMEDCRVQTISAVLELQDLLEGALGMLTPSYNPLDLAIIQQWNIAEHVPFNGEISYQDLAQAVSLKESLVRRVVRSAISIHRCFREKRPGFVSHSAASRLLAENSDVRDALEGYNEGMQASGKTVESLKIYNSEEPHESGYSLAFCPGKTYWQHFDDHPEKERRFARMMESFAKTPGYGLSSLVTGYDWGSLKSGSKVIDVGGGQGHASFAISKSFPDLKLIVQDLPPVIKTGAQIRKEAGIPEDGGPVRFVPHNFFDVQTEQADVFFLRWILHDWPDAYVLRILRNLVPALRPGNRVVINDVCLPPPGTLPTYIERRVSFYDLGMLALFNAKERLDTEWRELLSEADPRFTNIRSWTPPGSALSIIEATWEG